MSLEYFKDQQKKVIYEYTTENNDKIIMTDNELLCLFSKPRFPTRITGEILELIEYKNYVIIRYDQHDMLYNKKCGMVTMYGSLEHLEFNDCSYRFTCRLLGMHKEYHLDIFKNSRHETHIGSVLCVKKDEYINTKKLFRVLLGFTGGKYDGSLKVDFGTRIYKNYYEPKIIREGLHDLRVICSE